MAQAHVRICIHECLHGSSFFRLYIVLEQLPWCLCLQEALMVKSAVQFHKLRLLAFQVQGSTEPAGCLQPAGQKTEQLTL